MPVIKEYSPNIRWGKQIIEIVLMQWGYSKKFTVHVGGNTRGLSVLDCAVGLLADELGGSIKFEKPNGDTMLSEDDEDRGEDWVANMVVSIQIIDWVPPTLNEVRKMNGAKPLKNGNVPWKPDGPTLS